MNYFKNFDFGSFSNQLNVPFANGATTNGVILNDGALSLGANFSPVPTWGFAIAIVGAITLFWCFVPGFMATVKTRDTSQMSLLMWIITFIGLVFLVLFYALGMANSSHVVDGQRVVSSQFTVVFTCEGLSLLMSTYVFFIKVNNMIKAKSLGMTEAEYCAQNTAKRMSAKQAQVH